MSENNENISIPPTTRLYNLQECSAQYSLRPAFPTPGYAMDQYTEPAQQALSPSNWGNPSYDFSAPSQGRHHTPRSPSLPTNAEAFRMRQTAPDRPSPRPGLSQPRSSLSTPSPAAPSCGGRAKGQRNISDRELELFFEAAGEHLPMGEQGWAKAYKAYQKKAKQAKLPQRTIQTLKRKVKELIKEAGGKKPTGTSKKDNRLSLAWQLDWAIRECRECSDFRERFGAGVLDDKAMVIPGPSEDKDEGEGSEGSDDNGDDEDAVDGGNSTGNYVARKVYKSKPGGQASGQRGQSAANHQALAHIGSAFSPENMNAREAARDAQRTSLLELGHARQENQQLQMQVLQLQGEKSRAEMRAELAESKLEMEKDKFNFQLRLLSENHDHPVAQPATPPMQTRVTVTASPQRTPSLRNHKS